MFGKLTYYRHPVTLCGLAAFRSALPCRYAALVGVIKKHIEIAWHVAEQSEHERNLPAMVDAMSGGVVHEFFIE